MLLKSVTNGEYRTEIRALFSEYLHWAVAEATQRYDIDGNAQEMVDVDMQRLERLLPPNGRLYLAKVGGEFVGIGGLKQLDSITGEIKRMFVRDQVRGQGIGKMILDQLIADAHSLGYDKIYLDSPLFCEKAQLLYQTRGFRYLERAYPGNEDQAYHFLLKFMQLDL